jgi:hypothetical protein
MIKKFKTWLDEKGFDNIDVKKILNILQFFTAVSLFVVLIYFVFPLEFRKYIVKEFGKPVLVCVSLVVSVVLHLLLNIILKAYKKISPDVMVGGLLSIFKVLVWISCTIIVAKVFMKPATWDSFIKWFGVSATVLGTVLGIAFKDSINNFCILFSAWSNGSIRIKDPVKIAKHSIEGEIIKIGLTSVTVKNFLNNSEVIVPASVITSEATVNNRKINEKAKRLLEMECLVDFSSIDYNKSYRGQNNMKVFCDKIKEDLASCRDIDHDSKILFGFSSESNTGLSVKLRCFTMSVDQIEFKDISTKIFSEIMSGANQAGLKLVAKNNNNPNP